MNSIIEFDQLTRRFGRLTALDRVTFSVPPGAIFALTGINGAGKTTALLCALNLLRPTAGRCRLLGTDSTCLGPKQFASIGYISESRQLPEFLTVARFLAFCRPLYPTWDDGLAATLLRQYGLPLDRPLHSLSRGMRMQTLLAATLAYRPGLIVLDEPFGGLDIVVREQLVTSLIDLAPETTILLASHDIAEVETCATHIACLNQGRLLFAEETASLTSRFREVEVDLPAPCAVPAPLPPSWLRPRLDGRLLRFVDSSWNGEASETQLRQHFPGEAQFNHQGLNLRSILLTMNSVGQPEQISR